MNTKIIHFQFCATRKGVQQAGRDAKFIMTVEQKQAYFFIFGNRSTSRPGTIDHI